MHNVNPINSNMVLITENIMGHNSCALTNGIINCVMQQPVQRAEERMRSFSTKSSPRLCTAITTAVSDSANCPDTFAQRKRTRRINPLFALYFMGFILHLLASREKIKSAFGK